MGIKTLEEKGIALAPILIVIFIFFIPLSPTIKSIVLWCIIGVLTFTPYYCKLCFYTWNSPWGRAAVAFFLFIIIASLWSPAPYEMQWMVISKYCKLIYLPILTIGFINPKTRNWSLNAYLGALCITCILSILKARGILLIGEIDDQGAIFYNHIVTGFMVSFASYLAGLFVFQYKGWARIVYLNVLLLTSYQVLFINNGKTGYITYFILMILLLAQKMSFRHAALGILLLCGIFSLSYNISSTMHIEVNELINDVQLWQQNNKDTSLGYRIDFHQYAQSLFKERPIWGIGTGGFKYQFSQDNPIPTWGNILTDPHSQYWMTLAEQGVIGFFLFICFLVSLFLTLFKLKETRPILLGFLIIFCIGCISDTIFCYSAAGYLLIVFSALCFGELLEKQVIKNQSRAR